MNKVLKESRKTNIVVIERLKDLWLVVVSDNKTLLFCFSRYRLLTEINFTYCFNSLDTLNIYCYSIYNK